MERLLRRPPPPRSAAEALQQPQRRAYFLTNEGNFSPLLFLPPSLPSSLPLAPLHFTLSPSPSRSLARYFRVFLCERATRERESERVVERAVLAPRVGGENVRWLRLWLGGPEENLV